MPAPNKPTAALFALAGGLVLAGCGENPAIAVIPVRLELSAAVETVYVGRIETPLTATVYNAFDEAIPDADVTWSGDAPSVATVDPLTGAVTALAPGVVGVIARAGSVADTAGLFVLDDVRFSLPYDTILLAPQDTFTIEVDVAPGSPAPVIWFAGGVPGVATIDSATGLVTAIGAGSAAFVAQSDSDAVGGVVEVLALADTLGGAAHLGLSGAVTLSRSLPARARNHPTDPDDGRTLFQLRILEVGTHELDAILIDSLTGPDTREVETITAAGLGEDPVCLPPASFVFYRRGAPTVVTALSVGGQVTVTSDTAVTGGRIISGRLDVTLQRTDVAGPTGRIRARSTFVVPLSTLPTCPM